MKHIVPSATGALVAGMILATAAAAQEQPQPTAETPSTQQTPQGVAGFAPGASTLPPNAMPAIDALSDTLKKNPGSKIVIEGHTDNVGNPARNRDLAMERAQAVRSALVLQGVDVNRITVRSAGDQNPVASNDTPDGRRENRGARIIIGEMGASMVGSSQGSTSATSSGSGEQNGQSQQSPQSQQGQQGEQRRE